MFSNLNNNSQNYFMLFAGFHLSTPLTPIENDNSKGWMVNKKVLSNTFESNTCYTLLENEFNKEFNYPIGKPILVKINDLDNVFQMKNYLENLVQDHCEDLVSTDNIIWVFPTGVVLICVKFSIRKECDLTLSLFREIIGNHYPELTYLYVRIAEIIISSLNINQTNISYKTNEFDLCLKAIDFQQDKKITNKQNGISCLEQIKESPESLQLYEEILLDVYFVEYLYKQNANETRIDYRDTTIISDDPDLILSICLTYASFINLLWLRSLLIDESKSIQEESIKDYVNKMRSATNLRLLRVFILQFINQSTPTCIILTRRYIITMESCWREFRMHNLVTTINDQINTLDAMISAIEARNEDVRNFRIGLAALLISVISITAVVSDLINTIDINLQLDIFSRIRFIFIGFAIGSILVSLIYFFPLIKRK